MKKKKDCTSEAATENGRLLDMQKPSEHRYCQVAIHLSGKILIEGDGITVPVLIKALHKEGYNVRWDYNSPCG